MACFQGSSACRLTEALAKPTAWTLDVRLIRAFKVHGSRYLMPSAPGYRVLVCQHKACYKVGSAQILAAFQADPVLGVSIVASSCLGQCGRGPMVLILPEETWYCRVNPKEVPAVIDRHLRHGTPVKAMLDRKFHPG